MRTDDTDHWVDIDCGSETYATGEETKAVPSLVLSDIVEGSLGEATAREDERNERTEKKDLC